MRKVDLNGMNLDENITIWIYMANDMIVVGYIFFYEL